MLKINTFEQIYVLQQGTHVIYTLYQKALNKQYCMSENRCVFRTVNSAIYCKKVLNEENISFHNQTGFWVFVDRPLCLFNWLDPVHWPVLHQFLCRVVHHTVIKWLNLFLLPKKLSAQRPRMVKTSRGELEGWVGTLSFPWTPQSLTSWRARRSLRSWGMCPDLRKMCSLSDQTHPRRAAGLWPATLFTCSKQKPVSRSHIGLSREQSTWP